MANRKWISREGELLPKAVAVLQLIADGLTRNEIAERTNVTANDIDIQKTRIYAALGAKNAANAVSIAYQRGLLPL